MRGFERNAFLILGFAAMLTGCGSRPEEFMKEPKMSPIGSGLAAGKIGDQQDGVDRTPIGQLARPIANLYTDQTVTQVGDIVTVNIAINDKAQFDNATDRSKSAASSLGANWGYTQGGTGGGGGSQPSSFALNATSSSTTQGQGNIDRQEQIQVSVAAVVTEVLPNGNLVISGSQEVRVNYELRQLTVAGIVRPYDIARNNTISYDRIAEARISYGGRGRLNDVQQPNWGQQIWDSVSPF
jgi:flagellar L-ring protein precursor FlgH